MDIPVVVPLAGCGRLVVRTAVGRAGGARITIFRSRTVGSHVLGEILAVYFCIHLLVLGHFVCFRLIY